MRHIADELLLVVEIVAQCPGFPELVVPLLSAEQSEPEIGVVGIRE
jgi:hypothetical protein